jgi:trehalose 2-sulfotransferase
VSALPKPLDGIETGYESKFDFALAPHGPKISYLLASVPRAGSSFLSHELWRTGCLGAPLEYLNFDPAGPYHFAAASTGGQQKLWSRVLQTRTSPNGVFGLKGFLMQFHQLQRFNPGLLASVLSIVLPRDGPKRIVYLRRRDKIAQAVSYARASKSGVWRREQEKEGSSWIDYSREEIEAAERGIRVQEEQWEQMFSDLRIEPLRIWHEDALENPAAVAEGVARYLGVPMDPQQTVQVPPVLKQSEGNAAAWIRRYAEEKRASFR